MIPGNGPRSKMIGGTRVAQARIGESRVNESVMPKLRRRAVELRRSEVDAVQQVWYDR